MNRDPQPNPKRTAEFVELFARHQLKLLGYIMALVPRTEDAEDIMQEVSKALWESFDSFEENSNFLAWARKLAFHRVLEYRRRATRQGFLFPDDVLERISERWDENPAKSASSDRHDALRNCMEKLRDDDRSIIDARYFEGRQVQEIAESTGRPANSISKSLQRIRQSLLECIEKRTNSNP